MKRYEIVSLKKKNLKFIYHLCNMHRKKKNTYAFVGEQNIITIAFHLFMVTISYSIRFTLLVFTQLLSLF